MVTIIIMARNFQTAQRSLSPRAPDKQMNDFSSARRPTRAPPPSASPLLIIFTSSFPSRPETKHPADRVHEEERVSTCIHTRRKLSIEPGVSCLIPRERRVAQGCRPRSRLHNTGEIQSN